MPGLSMFRFLFYFCLSFIILSLPVGKDHLFSIIYKKTEGITSPIYSSLKKRSTQTYQNAKSYLKKSFSNATPDFDEISLESSGLEKTIDNKINELKKTEEDIHFEWEVKREREQD